MAVNVRNGSGIESIRGLAGLILWCGLLAAAPAAASFTFCNRTAQEIEAAFARHDRNQWLSMGWWRLPPQQCINVLSTPLTQRFYYYYARTTSRPMKIWGGKYQFCTDSKPFALPGDDRCEERHTIALGFAQIDIAERSQFVLDFRE